MNADNVQDGIAVAVVMAWAFWVTNRCLKGRRDINHAFKKLRGEDYPRGSGRSNGNGNGHSNGHFCPACGRQETTNGEKD